jgi:hypothetical protein
MKQRKCEDKLYENVMVKYILACSIVIVTLLYALVKLLVRI